MDFNAAKVEPHVHLSSVTDDKATSGAYKALKDLICMNQGAFIQFFFMASEYHKAIKNLVYGTSKPDPTAVAGRIEKLNKFLNEKTREICFANLMHLITHYDSRHSVKPRVCLKSFNATDSDNVVAIFRIPAVIYKNEIFKCGENTGLDFVKSHKTHYLCNDIPTKAASGEYDNHRLNIRSARNYNEGLWDKIRRSLNKKAHIVDESWMNCWTTLIPSDQKKAPDERSCYKSTLIIPITLAGNQLDGDFSSFFSCWRDQQETIFGFLCIDHIATNYFSEHDGDIDFGYIIADILSLYLITRHVFTTRSQSYNDSLELIKSSKTS
ncbi:MAG: hypothetical protein ACLGQW_11870 [Acidobacteriota bacterium]